MGDRNSITDFTKRVLILIALVAVAALALKLAYLMLLLFGSVVVAVIIRLIARQLERLGLSMGLATAGAVLAMVGAIAGFAWVFGGLVSSQFSLLYEQFPQAMERVQTLLDEWGLEFQLSTGLQSLGDQASAVFQRAGGFMMSAGSLFADLLLVLVAAIFMAANPDFYRRGLLRLLPKSCEPLAVRTLDDSGHSLQLWLAGQALASLFVAVLAFTGLTILGVPSAFALALIAGVFELIPYVGPIIAAVPAIFLGLSVDPSTGLWTLALYFVIQQVEGNVITPIIQKRAVELPPLFLLFSIFAAGTLFGAPGIVLAAPLTVVLYVMVQHLYIGHVLGRDPILPGHDDHEGERRSDEGQSDSALRSKS